MEDTGNIRAEAFRQAEQRAGYYLLFWLTTTALTAWLAGWWALVPGALSLRSLTLCMLSLSRERRLRRH